jgi:hypothetical protein
MGRLHAAGWLARPEVGLERVAVVLLHAGQDFNLPAEMFSL